MKMLKKTLALLLALVMVLGLFGCTSNTPAPETEPKQEETALPVVEEPAAPVIAITEENGYTKPITQDLRGDITVPML